jgi:hypothetical protein
MRKLFYYLDRVWVVTIVITASTIGMMQFGCKSSTQPTPSYSLVQGDLDNANLLVKTGIVGDTKDTVFHKVNDTNTYKYALREIYQNDIAKRDSAAIGALYVRKYYFINDTTTKLPKTLQKIMVMAKHETGFFLDGGDWEYITMSGSDLNNLTVHQNGTLPTVPSNWNPNGAGDSSSVAVRGKLFRCSGCHENRNMSKFLF